MNRKTSGPREKSFARVQPLLVPQQLHKCRSSNVMLWYSSEIAGLFVLGSFCLVGFFPKNPFCQLQFSVINSFQNVKHSEKTGRGLLLFYSLGSAVGKVHGGKEERDIYS